MTSLVNFKQLPLDSISAKIEWQLMKHGRFATAGDVKLTLMKFARTASTGLASWKCIARTCEFARYKQPLIVEHASLGLHCESGQIAVQPALSQVISGIETATCKASER